jgi:hypothetical protein
MATLVQACESVNVQTDGTCSAPFWTEQAQQVLPPLTGAEGATIGGLIVAAWIAGWCFRWLRKSLN